MGLRGGISGVGKSANDSNLGLRAPHMSLKDLHSSGYAEQGGKAIVLKDPTAAELEAYRRKLRQRRWRDRMIYGILGIGAAYLLYWFLMWLLTV